MAAIIGIALALGVGALARLAGLDRDRAFYPVVLIVVGSYYVLFAVMAGGFEKLWIELLFFTIFATAALLGFRFSLWIVAAGLAMHGVFDFSRELVLSGRGVPDWWPSFCAAYDLTAALVLAAIILRRPEKSTIMRGTVRPR
jgi:hypothetical protein